MNDAVVTVLAQITIPGQIFGFNVLRIIEEPTGAAKAYGLARMVQAAADDTHLGGEVRRQKLIWTPR